MNIPYNRKNLLNTCRQAFILLVGILSLVFCLDIPETYPEDASESYEFVRMWPTLPQPWYFLPSHIAVDTEGNLYVVDIGHRIQKFDSDGNFITKWGSKGSGDGEFYNIHGIAVDSNGNVYLADSELNRIQKFDSNGNFITKWGSAGSGIGQFYNPRGIAVDSNGNVYVTDANNIRVQKFDSDGNFITKWGSKGSGDGEFYNILGIAVDKEGNVYVVEPWNDRIQKFDSDGSFIATIGSRGSDDGEFDFPNEIAVDGNGNLYVADVMNDRIQKFDSNGNFIAKWGSDGSGDGQFDGPSGITIDTEGNVYVGSHSRIQKFDSDGNFITKWGSWGSGDGQFDVPSEITIDTEGNVYVNDRYNDRIQKFDSDGKFITKWGRDEMLITPIYSITVDAAGNVYVTSNALIQIFDSDGNFIKRWGRYGSDDGEFKNIGGTSVDTEGNLYVADSGNSRIQKFDRDGNFITKWGSQGSGNGQFRDLEGIAVGRTGNIYVIDENRIQKFDSNGNFKWESRVNENTELNYSANIATDSGGNVYVADKVNHRIQKFDSDGQFITMVGTLGSLPGQFNRPSDLDIDSNGNLYIVDLRNNRIQVLKKVTVVSESKAIIVAGGGPFTGNNLWDTTQMLANYAYKTLTFQGYTKDTIYYITADTDLDLDGNGIMDDVDADATNANLEEAITDWALDASDVVIYLVDHGGDGTFRMSGTEIMTAAELDSWLDILQESITGKLTVVYEACESGSFMDALAPSSGQDRMLITSTSPDENAYFVSKGSISFSFIFWGHIGGGSNVYDAFTLASNAISFSIEGQTPLLDDNGNGIGNEKEDGLVAINHFIGNGTEMGGDVPLIGSVSPERDLNGETTALIWADGIVATGAIEKVWAVIIRPDSIPASSDIPVTDLPILDLRDAGNDGRYEGTYKEFDLNGIYEINIYAKDRNGNISLPKSTSIFQQEGTSTGTEPLPDIKANGTDGLTMSQGFNLSVTVSLGPRTHSGENADWWVYATTSFGTYWYTLDSDWVPSSTPIRAYGGPLFSLPPYTILEMSTLPIGDYTFSFEIDDNLDNVKDGTYSDSVEVTIE